MITPGNTYINDLRRKNNNIMINKREVETKYSPAKTNSINEFLRPVKQTQIKYQEMLKSDLQGKTVSTDSLESSNNPKQVTGGKSSEPKPVKDAI